MNFLKQFNFKKAIDELMNLKFETIVTDKGEIIINADELIEGVEVGIKGEGEEIVVAPDGEYVTEDKIIVVAEGKVVEIREKEVEQPEPAEEEMAEEPEVQPEEPETDERDARIAEYEARINELEAMIAERDARIAELEAELAQKNEQLQMSADKPAKEKVKDEIKSGAMKYFK